MVALTLSASSMMLTVSPSPRRAGSPGQPSITCGSRVSPWSWPGPRGQAAPALIPSRCRRPFKDFQNGRGWHSHGDSSRGAWLALAGGELSPEHARQAHQLGGAAAPADQAPRQVGGQGAEVHKEDPVGGARRHGVDLYPRPVLVDVARCGQHQHERAVDPVRIGQDPVKVATPEGRLLQGSAEPRDLAAQRLVDLTSQWLVLRRVGDGEVPDLLAWSSVGEPVEEQPRSMADLAVVA